MSVFEWGLLGTLSALLACLVLMLAATLVLFTGGCYNFPGCNGFVMLPLIYLGLGGILFSLFSLDKIHKLKRRASYPPTSINTNKIGSRLKRAFGKLLYVLGIALPVAAMIGSLQLVFPFPCTGVCALGLGRLFGFGLYDLIIFDVVLLALAYLGLQLDPYIQQNLARVTGIAFLIGIIIPGWPTAITLLQFRYPSYLLPLVMRRLFTRRFNETGLACALESLLALAIARVLFAGLNKGETSRLEHSPVLVTSVIP